MKTNWGYRADAAAVTEYNKTKKKEQKQKKQQQSVISGLFLRAAFWKTTFGQIYKIWDSISL